MAEACHAGNGKEISIFLLNIVFHKQLRVFFQKKPQASYMSPSVLLYPSSALGVEFRDGFVAKKEKEDDVERSGNGTPNE